MTWWIKYAIAVALVGGVLGATYFKGRHDAASRIEARLKDDRITILKDGRRIDDKVENLDDAGLCVLLGGCLSDSAGND